ncbi:LysE family translocator [Psychrobacter sp.]|uniref:LysE family translocator n=1 Tax=Psychrobacter sp. TaxID=56811 RepID=UPI0025CFD6BF|nr:LysE family translocator [Psychrobacter sp.]
MSASTFLLFFFSVFLLSATPGPNMLLAFQYGLNHGVRSTIWVLLGLSFGLLILLVSALLGIDFINRQLPWLLTLLKGVGALYLMYLGLQIWRHADDDSSFASAEVHESNTIDSNPNLTSNYLNSTLILKPPLQRFRQGVWVSLSNPKAILFFAAFFPKFIDFKALLWPQYIILTLGFFASEITWQIIYTLGGTKLSSWLNKGSRLLWLNRLCGLIFIFIALALLWEVFY